MVTSTIRKKILHLIKRFGINVPKYTFDCTGWILTKRVKAIISLL